MEVIMCEDSSDVIGDGTSGLARFASLQSLESFFFSPKPHIQITFDVS